MSKSAAQHQAIWRVIDQLAEDACTSPSGLAKRAGLDSTAFNKSKRTGPEGRLRWPGTEAVFRVLDVTGVSLSQWAAMVEAEANG